jgi:hypothetical protein
MKPVLLLALFTLGVAASCNNQGSQKKSAEEKKDTVTTNDTVPIANQNPFEKSVKSNPAYYQIISWDDFRSDSVEFDKIRKKVPAIKNAKTVYVAFHIDSLVNYLTFLSGKGIDSVNVFLGKYVDSDRQPSGTPIERHHRAKLTVMFAGKGTNKSKDDKLDDKVPPYNVGNPYP